MEITIENLVGICAMLFLAHIGSLIFTYYFGKSQGFSEGVKSYEKVKASTYAPIIRNDKLPSLLPPPTSRQLAEAAASTAVNMVMHDNRCSWSADLESKEDSIIITLKENPNDTQRVYVKGEDIVRELNNRIEKSKL